MRALVIVIAAVVVVHAEAAQKSAPVSRLDPALDAVISANAKLDVLKEDHFGLNEGPLWIREGRSGYLLLSDIGANAIYKWTADGTLSLFLDKAGYTGPGAGAGKDSDVGNFAYNGRLNVGTFGPNGIALDRQGRVVYCAQGDRAIVRLEKDGARTVLADRYEGKRLNSPNDLVVKSDDSIYFTDPAAGLRGGINSPGRELPFTGVFMIRRGTLRLVEKDFTPNGLAFTPDEKRLYVNGNRQIRVYDVDADGALKNGRLFIDMSTDPAPGGPDGMKVDEKGNVYSAGPGGVWIVSPDGKHLGTIKTPLAVTNVAFGDADGKSLYITARRDLYKIRTNIPGIRP